jgi:hypothetical protein
MYILLDRARREEDRLLGIALGFWWAVVEYFLKGAVSKKASRF